MSYGIWDEEKGKILSDEDIDKEGLYLDRTGRVMQFDVNWRHNKEYTKHWVFVDPTDVTKRYKPLMKVGCG